MTDQQKIEAKLATLDPDDQKREAEAKAQGYKDEVCKGCGVVFLAFKHLVLCYNEPCPMKSPSNVSLLDRIEEASGLKDGQTTYCERCGNPYPAHSASQGLCDPCRNNAA